jgi:hypothetical protein
MNYNKIKGSFEFDIKKEHDKNKLKVKLENLN